jgi:ABC-type transport system involved in cytochrome c biogenesis permease subunit
MASESIPAPGEMSAKATRSAAASSIGPKDIAVAVLTPLSSLKLTVFLLVAATVVTWIATLDQTRADIWEVKNKHFQNVLVEVPFQTFFVPGWFPELQNVKGSFYVPSGVTILVTMLINLMAAHLLRFKLQAKGLKLVVGILAAIGAAVITWAIIFNGQNPDGFQAEPPLSWDLMWRMLQVGVLGIGIAAAYGAATMERDRRTERIVLGVGAFVILSALGGSFLLTADTFIGDSAMRILWQLLQASVAGTAALAACMLLFKRKAGIVVVHLGLAGLMMNEIYVTATNEEQRMMIEEGQTVSTAIDIREVEFVAINQEDPEVDEIIVVPGERLRSGEWIAHPDLPFQVRCESYLRNARLIRDNGSMKNDATIGLGSEWVASATDAGIGTDIKQVADSAAAYVALKREDGESLGTYMVAQVTYSSGMVDSIQVDDEQWQIGLRFKTAYKPYSLTLNDVQAEYYLSTDTPRWFASEVTLSDSRTGTESEQRIWMNNPLRYADETFYQSNYERDLSGNEITVLQVVRNEGWMIPYVCCMFTVIGLVAQFGSSLTSHLEKQRKKAVSSQKLAVDSDSKSTGRRSWRSAWLAIGLTAFFGLYVAGQFSKAARGKADKNGFRLDQLGQIPVSFNGRVQPLDSLARNTARQLGNRETVVDKDGKKQPAIAWLADTVFEKPGFDTYRILRIEDPAVRSALGLEEGHDRFLYSLKDLEGAEQKIPELVKDSLERWPDLGEDMDKWPMLHQRLWSVGGSLNKIIGIRSAFGDPAQRVGDSALGRMSFGNRIVKAKGLPLAVPTGDDDKSWISFAESLNRQWVADTARDRGVDSMDELVDDIAQTDVLEPMREDMIRRQMVSRMVSDEDVLNMLKKQSGVDDSRELADLLMKNWDAFPEETYASLEKSVAPLVDSMIAPRAEQMTANVRTQLEQIAGPDGVKGKASAYPPLAATLASSYVDGKPEQFNKALDDYLGAVSATPPTGMRPTGIRWEHAYNVISPFYLAMVIYLAAFVIAGLGWLGFMKPFQQAATWLLLLGLALQVTGLVMRVVISGRPPVTNLYSSVLFVSAAYVLLMLIVERVTKIGMGNAMAGLGGCVALLWAWSMSIVDGDTFAVLVAVLDTQFWLSTHVIIISLGYSATLAAGFLGLAYIVAALAVPGFDAEKRKLVGNLIYGIICFGLLASFFGTVLGGLWGDDSWGRFWGWDPKENGALMIVLWNAVLLHARWGGMIKTRGLAALAVIGNIVTLWSWKGVNAMGVGLHAYAATEDTTMKYILIAIAGHLLILLLAMIPTRFWFSHSDGKA